MFSKTRAFYIKMMELSVDRIFVKYLHKSFPVTIVKPNYHSVHNMWNLPYDKGYTLTTTLGGGNHRHIGIVM